MMSETLLLFVIILITFISSRALESNFPRPDQISLGFHETKLLDLNDFIIGENVTIAVNASDSNISLVDYQLYPPITFSPTLNIPDSLKIINTEIEHYIYALSQQNILYMIGKTNYQNVQTMNLNQYSANLKQCMSLVIISNTQLIIDCDLSNSTQVFIIVLVQNNVLSFNTTQIAPQVFQNNCSERRLVTANEYFFKYCPCDSSEENAKSSQIFTLHKLALRYITDINQASLGLTSPLCIQNFTGTSQFSDLNQIVLADKNNGVISFLLQGQPPNATFQLGVPIFLPSSDLKYLARKTFNNSQYELKFSTNFLIQLKNNFVYEISASSQGYSLSHEYLLKNNHNISGAAITQDYVVFMIEKNDTASTLKIMEQQTSILFYTITLNSNVLLGASDLEPNDVYVVNTQAGSTTQITKITFNNNLLKLSCCSQQITSLSPQQLSLSVCDLNDSRCFNANLTFYVFPDNFYDPILVQKYNLTQKVFADSQEFKIPLRDLIVSPVPSIFTSKTPERISLYLNQSFLFHDIINGSSEIIINDLYEKSSFIDMYWLEEGKTLDIVAQLKLNNKSNIQVIRCNMGQDKIESCSIIQTFQDLGLTIRQIIYSNSKLYVSLGDSAFIYAFYGDTFEFYLQTKNPEIQCKRISVNTQSSGDLYCFSDNQICLFNFNFKGKSTSFLGCFYNLSAGTIVKVNDYFLDNQFLLIGNETHVIALETSNTPDFTQIFAFQVCSSFCQFEVYLHGLSSLDKKMIILDFTHNFITEYDINNPSQILFLRNYPLYGARLSQSFQLSTKPVTEFLPVFVENCCLQDPTHASLFIYNPEVETNQLLFAISQGVDPQVKYYYFTGDQFASVASIDPNNLQLINFYGIPQIGFNISLDSHMLQEAFIFNVSLDYTSFPQFTSQSPVVEKEFSVICDFSNFYISNISVGENITIDFSNRDSYPIRAPFLGPLSDFALECNTSSNSSCPYTLRSFYQRYFFYVNYYQTVVKYGYPMKLHMIDNHLVHLTQKTLNILKIGAGPQDTTTTDITPYGQCFDLIIVNSTIYILCQCYYQTFSLLVQEYSSSSSLNKNPTITELEIPLQFQGVQKVKIHENFIFLLGNSTQTSSISDISIYQFDSTTISHIQDFSTLFPEFTSFTIQEFDIQLITTTMSLSGNSSRFATFLIYTDNLYYTEITLTTFDNGTTTVERDLLIPIQVKTLFNEIYEVGSLQYISIENLMLDELPTMDFTNYTCSVLLGTSFNIYSANITWDTIDFYPLIVPNTIYKGYSGCTTYYGEQLKYLDEFMATLCYQVNQNKTLGPLGGKIFTLLLYNQDYNNVSRQVDNQNVSIFFPITMISRQIVENVSSFVLYDTDSFREKTHHVILSNSLLQFEDYVVFDGVELVKDPNYVNPIDQQQTVINLTAINKYSQQKYTLIINNHPNNPKPVFLIETYLIIFGASMLVLILYQIKNCCKQSRLFKRTRRYETDDDDDYSMIMKTKSLMHS